MNRSADNPTDDLLRSHGAVFGAVVGAASVPLHYARPQEEYDALTRGAALVARTWASRLILSGADRVRFLNGMTTCDVRNLEDGQGAYGFLTTAQGRILSDLFVSADGDRLDLELPSGLAPVVAEHFGRYIVADRVEISQPSGGVRVDLAGPTATVRVAGRPSIEVGEGTLPLVETGRYGAAGFSAWIEVDELAGLLGRAADERGKDLPTLVGYEAWETVRVEAGRPRFGQDFDAENLPQETGFDDAVSYAKGCYLGQEIVARIHYRGQVPRGPRSLRLDSESRPPLATPIRYDGHEVGRLSSVVRSPAHGSVLGLALLHRRAWEPGTRVEIDGAGEALVLPLAAARPPDSAGE